MPDKKRAGSIKHTSRGLKNLSLFYKKPIVYVEGKDDILFWQKLFFYIASKEVHCLTANKHSLVDIAKELSKEAIHDLYIAMDSDYSYFCGEKIKHKQVLYTYGYSIENTMYCNESIATAIQKTGRLEERPLIGVKEWKEHFTESIYDLLIADTANECNKLGLNILGKNCARFLQKDSPNLSKTKIKHKLGEIKAKIPPNNIAEIEKIIKKNKKKLFRFIRGHFITNAIIKLFKKIIIKHSDKGSIAISSDHVYSNCVDGCLLCLNTKCDEMKYYRKILSAALS